MIFVDETLENWMKKYPGLSVLESRCEACGLVRKTDKPFLLPGYAGLTAGDCICGNNTHTAITRVTTNEKTRQKWRRILFDWIGET